MKRKKTGNTACAAAAWLATHCLWMTAAPDNALAADTPAQPLAAAAPEAVDVEVFQGPRFLRIKEGDIYPYAEVREGGEGWVELNMMIDPKGKPYEIMVVNSSGNPAFEKAATTAAGGASFEPARRGDSPIDSSYTWKLRFNMNPPAKGASVDFVSAYKQAVRAIEAGKKDEAEAQLGRMHPHNLYEDAFQHYSQFLYHHKWGTPEQQLLDLKGAVAGEKKAGYLPASAFTAAMVQIFSLDVRARDYGDALNVWKDLEPIAPPELHDPLQRTVDQIHAVQLGNDPVRLSATVAGNNTWWFGKLFRNRFSIDVTRGSISEIKLRCQKQYLFFKYQAGVQYSIGARPDQCSIQVVAEPATTFDLVQ